MELVEVKVSRREDGSYSILANGREVAEAKLLERDKWQLRMNEDPPGRRRRPFTKLSFARSHVLRLMMNQNS